MTIVSHRNNNKSHNLFYNNNDHNNMNNRNLLATTTTATTETITIIQDLMDDEYDTNNHQQQEQQQEYQEPKIVWLMSFPNSGTSYTSQLVRDVTYTDTASNYADETPIGQHGIYVPVYDDQPMGPFWIMKPEETNTIYTEPTKYILTKTHCGMRCTLCPPEKYSESSYSFRRRCLTTKWVEEQRDSTNTSTGTGTGTGTYTRIFGQYLPDRVEKAIHLIRDPFHNIISRFHLDYEISGRKANEYEKSRTGFRSYCQSIDTMYMSNEDRVHFLDDELLQIIRQVPCHEDFIRYVEWHNLAFSTADDLGISTYVLHYEWYKTRFDTTLNEILTFLELERKGEPVPFNPSISYDYFTKEERNALKKAYRMMASSRTWVHIAQYFELDTIDMDVTTN